jgi:HlyD family secretion protein
MSHILSRIFVNFVRSSLVVFSMSPRTLKSRKGLYAAIGGAVVLIGAVAGFVTLDGASADVDPSRLATVEPGAMVRSVVATGKIEPVTKVEIKSKANGIIKALHVDLDSVVNEGDILVELDKEQLMAQLRGAEANLLAARAALEGAEAQLKKNTVEAEGPDAELARKNLTRAVSLFAQGLIAQSALDDAQSALDVAENRKHAAQSQLAVSQARVAEARAQVAQARAAADHSAEDLANATIRAPIRGTVLTRDVEIGSPVSSILNLGANATLVMTLGDIDRMFVRGRVDEADIGRLRLDQPARIRVETFKDQVFKGRVTQISPMGVEKDNVTSFEVRVSIDNPEMALKANMTANAEVVLEEHEHALLIPEAAVSYDAQKQAFVDVVTAGARKGRRRTPVKLGVGNGTKIEVLQGLKQGDRVVLPS